MNIEHMITEFFIQYAYKPDHVYIGIVIFMTLSSFGLPIPEEVVLVSAGFIAFMANHPQIYPPPYEGAVGVNMELTAIICFLAVVGSDLLVFSIGRYGGEQLFETKFFKKNVGAKRLAKIKGWFHSYSVWACGIFRFTPGLRFPAHLTCGAMKIPVWKFLTIDGSAALLSVPTQVLLVAIYGREILDNFKRFKLFLIGGILLFIIFYLIRKWFPKKEESTLEVKVELDDAKDMK